MTNQTTESYCFGRYNRIEVVKAVESAWIVGLKVVNDSFLNDADWVVGLSACKHAVFGCVQLTIRCQGCRLQVSKL